MATKVTKRTKMIARLRSTPVLVACSLVVVGSAMVPTHGFGVLAASCSTSVDCQQKIDKLNSQNSAAQSSLSDLETKAGSYKAAIAALQDRIASVQADIDKNQAQQSKLEGQIAAAQKELKQQKSVLANDIKTLYVSGQITPVEMLATSNSISSYVDKQEAYSAVQDKVQETLAKIQALQAKLKSQKAQVDQLLKTLDTQRAQVTADRNQQVSLLSYNESQQTAFNQKIKSNKKALSQLYAQQAAIIAASFSGGYHYGGTGGYPYAGAVCMNSDGCGPYSSSPYNWGVNGQPYDPLGWQYRNCTSYAFWRLAQTTGIDLSAGYFPSVYNSGGEIKYSVLGGDFARLGYSVNHNPNGAAVLAVQTAGTYGHIMYVEAVNAAGNAIVSQYNAGEDGRYSTGTLSPSSTIWFIHVR